MLPMTNRVIVQGHDIERIIMEKLSPAMDGERMEHILMSLMTFAYTMMKPSIERDELKRLVEDTTAYMSMQLMPTDGLAN